MADAKKSTSKKTESKPDTSKKASTPSTGSTAQNGKGDAPRNCFSDEYLKNFDSIDWSK